MARTRAEMTGTRERLVETARRAFARDGFAAMSMDALTAAAGLTRGALHHNFGDKTGLWPPSGTAWMARWSPRPARSALRLRTHRRR